MFQQVLWEARWVLYLFLMIKNTIWMQNWIPQTVLRSENYVAPPNQCERFCCPPFEALVVKEATVQAGCVPWWPCGVTTADVRLTPGPLLLSSGTWEKSHGITCFSLLLFFGGGCFVFSCGRKLQKFHLSHLGNLEMVIYSLVFYNWPSVPPPGEFFPSPTFSVCRPHQVTRLCISLWVMSSVLNLVTRHSATPWPAPLASLCCRRDTLAGPRVGDSIVCLRLVDVTHIRHHLLPMLWHRAPLPVLSLCSILACALVVPPLSKSVS